MISEDQIKYIAQKYPNAQGNNTWMYRGVLKEAAEQAGHEWPEWLDEIMDRYKPESVIRKRRYVFPPTDEQLEKEEEYRATYSDHC